MLESQEMRKVYCDTMIALAKEDPRIVDVEADLTGAHGMKPFKAAYPDRSFNVGIAEANMVGVAAGLEPAADHDMVDQQNLRMVDTILGFVLGTAIASIFNWLYGTTVRSATKDDTIKQLVSGGKNVS